MLCLCLNTLGEPSCLWLSVYLNQVIYGLASKRCLNIYLYIIQRMVLIFQRCNQHINVLLYMIWGFSLNLFFLKKEENFC